MASPPVTLQTLKLKKRQGEKVTALTCYDYSTALILDDTPLDLVLVGDSLAMTILGHPDTLSVTVDEMLHHVKAVSRGLARAFLVADMPFMSYQVDFASAVKNAGRFMQEGRAKAVKLEGAAELTLQVIRHLVSIGIPVMGHIGLTPQAMHQLGGFKLQGKSTRQAQQIMEDALKLEEAGVFGLVLEMIPVELAQDISRRLTIPTIGIGAGNGCDGQILVVDDILGRYPKISPKFVRTYLHSAPLIQAAIEQYCQDVQAGTFPNNETEAYPLNVKPKHEVLV